jgi:pimeloyl-ACP methyl ester carboxylesterase
MNIQVRPASIDVPFKKLSIKVAANILQRTGNCNGWAVFLHGLQSNRQIFNSYFEDAGLANYSLLSIDLVGFGDSDKPSSFTYDLKDQVEILFNLIHILKIKKAFLVGHSLGGMIATMALGKFPEFLNGVVSLEGNLAAEDCGESAQVARMTNAEFELGYEQFKLRVRDSGGSSGMVRYVSMQKTPAFAFYKTAKSIVDWSSTSRLLELFLSSPQPKLFIKGSLSKFNSKPAGTNIKFVEISGSGHFMLVERESETRSAVVGFLRTI